VDNCPKEKGEGELKDQAEQIQAGKLVRQRLAKELLQSKDSEVTDMAYVMAREASKVPPEA
jgi:hypothetical protein